MTHFKLVGPCMVLLAAWAFAPPLAFAQRRCAEITTLVALNLTITSAVSVPAGPFTPPPDLLGNIGPVDVPDFCRVAGILKPTADSQIKFEVWMPATSWNGKFQDVGNGGFAGLIAYRAMIDPLQRGYATASTDDGHVGAIDVSWAIGHPEKVIDFGYRAVHETAQVSKTIIHSFYGKDAEHSYFNGCSDGGREALMEAQRFPADFEGIVVGAPANSWTHQFAGFVWNEQATLNDPASYIPPSKLPALQAAALAACSDLGGATEGILEDPRPCRFDPAVIQCKEVDGPNCLTAAQVEAAKRIYAGPRNPRTRQQIYPGYQPGAEAAPGNWPAWITGPAPGNAIQFFFGNAFFASMVFENPKWEFRTLDFDRDIKLADDKLGPILNSTNPDLGRFQARGGKMIQYHGWADAAVAPTDSINYYEGVVSFMNARAHGERSDDSLRSTQAFYRLFMVPGMGHCSGGPGADDFGNRPLLPPLEVDAEHDVVSALDRWVVSNVAPEKIIATQYTEGSPARRVVQTHLLCPYPQVAEWKGQGGKDSADNFVCRLPK
ncbi:MAG: tannase/feruloyl esterase family alpha/beta hydrolase [Terriglobia bacterium]